MTRIVVTGGSGVFATALRAVLPNAIYLTRADCDIRNVFGVRNAFARCAPDIVIHAAALTDHQTTDFGNLIATNVFGTQNVAVAAKGVGAALIYLSTHYVYPGEGPYYTEGSRVAPIGAYAWSKLAGEQWVKQLFRANLSGTARRSLIVRGSWYDRATRLDGWAARGALSDAWCSREPVADAAQKIAALALAAHAGTVAGVVNIGGARRTFAEILRDEGYRGFPQRTRIQLDEVSGLPYIFPLDISVNTEKFEALGLQWRS